MRKSGILKTAYVTNIITKSKGDRFELRTYKEVYSRPVMAVLVTSRSISGFKKQIANPRIQLLVDANNEVNTTLYFFSIKEVNLREQKISGYFWHKTDKRWLHRDFPFPDILYIRCEISKRYTQTLKELSNYITKNNGKLITHYPFNKWQLYQILNQDPVMKRYLPATRTFKQPDDIKNMLQRYKVIYLKSHFGKKGENVLRVEALPGGGYQYSYYRNEQLTAMTVSDFQALLNVVKTFFQEREFLIQQGIEMMKLNDRLIDMRAELQYNGDGLLEIVGISVRQGQPGSPITTHGDAFRFEDFFVKRMGYSNEQLETLRLAVHEFLFNVYKYLEDNYSKYPEIGIDFATDDNNNIWFIEANARSTKVSLNKAYGEAVLYRNSKKILEYARYLFNQSNRGAKKPVVYNSPEAKPTKTTRVPQKRWAQDHLRGYQKYSSPPDTKPIITTRVPQKRWTQDHSQAYQRNSQRCQLNQVRHYGINKDAKSYGVFPIRKQIY